jgi:hypothetical protein
VICVYPLKQRIIADGDGRRYGMSHSGAEVDKAVTFRMRGGGRGDVCMFGGEGIIVYQAWWVWRWFSWRVAQCKAATDDEEERKTGFFYSFFCDGVKIYTFFYMFSIVALA